MVLSLLGSAESQKIKLLKPPLKRADLFHFLHKKPLELLPEITRSLQEMEQQGLTTEQSPKGLIPLSPPSS